MSLFALDNVRNARINRRLEPLLEETRALVAAARIPTDVGSREEILEAYDQSRARFNLILNELVNDRGKSGVDVSTGLGFLPPLARRLGLDIVATERDPELALFAADQGIEVRPYTIGDECPPFADSSVDFLIFSEVLEHLRCAPGPVLTDLAHLLRSGGMLILTTPNVARRSNIEALLAGENFLEAFPADLAASEDAVNHVEHVREYSIRETVDAVEMSGLCVDRVLITGWGEPRYYPPANPWLNDIIAVVAHKDR
ncbi:MAG: class I SAM-dependent methyltransferase [Chloroflexota bacterium]